MSNFQAADCTPGASSDDQSPSYPANSEKLPTFMPTTSIINGGASLETKNVRTFYYGLSSNPGPGSSMTNFGGETTPLKGDASDLFGGGRSRLMNAQAVQSDSVNTFGDSFPPGSNTVGAYKKQQPHSLNH